MQIIYISKRPKILAGTLQRVQRFIPFVDEALVLGPRSIEPEVVRCSGPGLRVRFVPEEAHIERATLDEIRSVDHQSRNYALRRHLVRADFVGSEFLMSDDDARPLKEVRIEDFKTDGRHRAYFFHDLKKWPATVTEFDIGQCSTGEILSHFNMPTLAYASHMPQIIDRQSYLDAAEYLFEPSKRFPICEWSSYFNFAVSRSPERFHEPEPYRTLCWPDTPVSWPSHVPPRDILFENYYPHLYVKGGPFHGLQEPGAPGAESDLCLDKQVAWRIHLAGKSKLDTLMNWLTRVMSRSS